MNFMDVTEGGPDYFVTRNLLRLPESKSSSMSYGTAIHAALELAQILTNKDMFSINAVLKKFETSLHDENMPEGEYQRYLNKGKLKMKELLGTGLLKLNKGSLPEQDIKDIRLDTAILSGKLDRIDLYNNKAVVIDYKTGTALKSLETRDKNKAIKAWKNKLQLIYYALLMSKEPRYRNLQIDCQMIYLEADKPSDMFLTYTPSKDDIDMLSQLIEIVWNKIVNLDLPDTSSYSKDIDGVMQFQQDLLEKKV